MDVINQIETILSNKGISKFQLAKLMGKPHNYVYDCLNGNRGLALKFLKQIAETLDHEVVITLQEKNNA